MVRVLLVDDHDLVVEGLRSALDRDPRIEVLDEHAKTAETALRLVAGRRPDVVCLDVRLPDSAMDGLEACAALRERHPGVGVVVYTGLSDAATLRSALASGARGVAVKNSDSRELREAVLAAAAGECYVDQTLQTALAALIAHGEEAPAGLGAEAGETCGLTVREMNVLRLLPRERNNEGISQQLGLGSETVKSHVSSVLGKLGATNRAHAVEIALRKGLL